MSLIEQPYIVLDQNVLRDEAQIKSALALTAEYQARLLLPDVALMEMMKNEHWEDIARQSLALLSTMPSRVAIAWGAGELLRREHAAGQPQIDLVDEEVTNQFRSMLAQLAKKPETALDDLRPYIPGAQTLAQRQHLDHARNKDRVLRMVTSWKAVLTPEGIDRLRKERERDH